MDELQFETMAETRTFLGLCIGNSNQIPQGPTSVIQDHLPRLGSPYCCITEVVISHSPEIPGF